LAAGYELLGIVVSSFFLNIIPFAGPSNLMIASGAALLIDADPVTIGLLVAFGSASAKLIHYMVSFFVQRFMSEERRKRLNVEGLKFKRWAFLALFVVAATPLPDEPVVIPLGLLKYNPAKFYLAYFLGKLSITVLGAYLGKLGQQSLTPWISTEMLMVVSIVLTIVVTVVLLKVDVGKIAEKVLKRKRSGSVSESSKREASG
jgi:membrane protein YqaA with SNARE-associated domain